MSKWRRSVVGLALVVVGTLLPTPALAEVWEADVEKVAVVVGAETSGVAPFEMIAVSWTGRATAPPMIEIHDAGGWHATDAETPGPDAGPDDRTAEARAEVDHEEFSEPVWVGSADGYRIGGAGTTPTTHGRVTVHLIRQHRTLRPAATSDDAGAAPASPDGPPVNSRSAWGAQPPRTANGVARTIRFAVVHHTAGSNDYSPSDVPAILRGVQSFHQNSRGWNDIAYNFLIDRWGGIWEGRAGGIGRAVVGSHAAGFNTGTVGISLMGDFTNVEPTPDSLEAVAQVAGWKLALHGVRPDGTTTVQGTASNVFPAGATVTIPTIVGHRDVGVTGCPGRVWNHLGSIRARAAQRSAYAIGHADAISQVSKTQVHVSGWGFDRRSTDRARYVVDVNGNAVVDQVTSVPRPDVVGVHAAAPALSGFAATVTLPGGTSEVCVYVAETSYGALTHLGCRSFTNPIEPVGNFETLVAVPGGARATGWAFDPDTADPIGVHVYVDGRHTHAFRAASPRPDVGRFLGIGDHHGWSVDIPLTPGRHEVCAYALNVGPGATNPLLGCRTIGGNPNPVGTLDGAFVSGAYAGLFGWAIDDDTTGPIPILFFVNDRMAWLANANLPWPNLAPFFPRHGIHHGFFTAMPLPRGHSNVCAYAVNVGPGDPATLIGCRALVRP